MRKELFIIAESAHNFNNRLTIVGTFDTITLNKYPHTHPALGFAAKFLADPKDYGKTYPAFFLLKKENKVLLEFPFDVRFKKPKKGHPASFQMAINVGPLTFPSPGTYSVQLKIGNNIKGKTNLYLRKKGQ